MPRNPEVYEATKNYVAAALAYLEEHHGPGPGRQFGSWPAWRRTQPGEFVQEGVPTELWSPISAGASNDLHALPEYEECVAALRADPKIRPQLDTLVGTATGASRIEASTIADGILTRLASEVGAWRFDEARFDAAYEEYESALFADSFAYVLIAPLPGLTSDALPIRLDDRSEIDTMTEDEALACIHGGLFGPTMGALPLISIRTESALRVTTTFPKVVGDMATWSQDALDHLGTLHELAWRVVVALRLATAHQIVAPGTVHFPDNPLSARVISFGPLALHPRRIMFATTYDLGADDVAALTETWGQLSDEGVKRHKELGVALRRYSDAADRERRDDALIDLMIAAEALFLPGIRDELKYRLALRAAFFIAEDMGLSRRDVFSHMSRAYNARSILAHGGSLRDLKLADGTHVPLDEFVRVTTDHLRVALRKAVRLANGPPEDQPFDKWDDLILGG